MKRGKKRVTITDKLVGESRQEQYWDNWAARRAAIARQMTPLNRPTQIICPTPALRLPPGHRPEWCPACRKKVCAHE